MKHGFIDATRGTAILMVILVHTSFNVALPSGWLSTLTQYGQMGVQMFFVASAYTLMLSYFKRRGEQRGLSSFYLRRLFRIAPVYYLGILLYFTVELITASIAAQQFQTPEDYTPINILANVLLLNGMYYPANNNIVPGGWSIGTEVLFYAAFPILAALTYRLRSNRYFPALLPILALTGSASIVLLTGNHVGNNGFVYYSILNQFPAFAVGIALYLIHQQHGEAINAVGKKSLVALALGYAFLALHIAWIKPLTHAFMIIPLVSAVSFAFFIEYLKRIDESKLAILRSIGQRSYSMYIFHFLFAEHATLVIDGVLPDRYCPPGLTLALCFAMTVAASYCLAGFSVKYIETPFIQFGKKLIQRMAASSASEEQRPAMA